jgi:hypothetical protein
VGEVLGYCDPVSAIQEFSRVLAPAGLLICDFGSSLSTKRRFTESFGRAADLIVDHYNGSPEQIWIYHPDYICAALESSGFKIKKVFGTHTWSALARRFGVSIGLAIKME